MLIADNSVNWKYQSKKGTELKSCFILLVIVIKWQIIWSTLVSCLTKRLVYGHCLGAKLQFIISQVNSSAMIAVDTW